MSSINYMQVLSDGEVRASRKALLREIEDLLDAKTTSSGFYNALQNLVQLAKPCLHYRLDSAVPNNNATVTAPGYPQDTIFVPSREVVQT